jgi:hypothetical protein
MASVGLVQLLNSPIQVNIEGGLVPNGVYDNGTAYSVGDSVSYLGSSYVALTNTTGNLPTDTSFWQLVASKGDTGATGPVGSFTESFESVSKNLAGHPYVLGFTGPQLTTITYTLPASQEIVKTLGYTGDKLTTITLSGDIPGGIDTVKTITYIGDVVDEITYS